MSYETGAPAGPNLTRRELESSSILDAQAGDHVAFCRLVIAHRRRILVIVSRIIRRPEDAEDVTQEVCLRLYHSLHRLKSEELFDAWLYRLTVNAAYDYLRKRRRLEKRMSDLSELQVFATDAAAGVRAGREHQRRENLKELMDSLLQSLSERDRMLLLRKEIEGLSIKQLAKIYSVDETAVKVRLFRARQKVRALGIKDY